MKTRQIALPISTERIIAANDSVRILDEMIDKINISFNKYRKNNHLTSDKTMLKIIIYGNMEQVTSVRKLEKACRRDINFKWLLQDEAQPSKSSIGRYIQNNEKVLTAVLNEVVKYLISEDEITYEEVYIDGTKIEANANKYSFVWRKAVEKHDARLNKKIEEIMIEINDEYKTTYNANQVTECLEFLSYKIRTNKIVFVHGKGKRKTQIQRDYEALSGYIERKHRYSDYNSTFNGRNSFSKTDKDATFMHMKEDHMRNSQLKPGYNMQIAVNSEYIVGLDISSERSDQLTLIPLLEKLKKNLPQKHTNIVADAGYESEENYQYLKDNSQTSYIKPQNYEQMKKRSYKKWVGKKENMQYDIVLDEYTCINGRKIKYRNERYRKSKSGYKSHIKVYECDDCTNCKYKSRCVRSKYENYNKKLWVADNFAKYREESLKNIKTAQGIILRINRSIQVEGAFGVLKQDYGFRRLKRRGYSSVKSEFTLLCIAYNINKYSNKKEQNRCVSHIHLPRAG